MDVSATQTEQTRQDLELKLQELIECLLELSITVYDFQTESGSLVHQKMYETGWGWRRHMKSAWRSGRDFHWLTHQRFVLLRQ